MAEGQLSRFGFWAGGFGSPPSGGDIGFRAIPGFWVGGFGAPASSGAVGFRSPLGFWLGGFANSGGTPPANPATPRMWHLRGGFGRQSLKGRGYSR